MVSSSSPPALRDCGLRPPLGIQGKTRDVEDGDVLQIGSLRVTCLHTPAHTNGV